MINLQSFSHELTDNKAANIIFDACRANEKRVDTGSVTFRKMTNGDYQATVRDANGYTLARAEVDQFDC